MKQPQTKYYFRKILFISLLIFGVEFCKKETLISFKKEFKQNERLVQAEGGLNVRETPDQTSKVMFLIPNFSTVETLDEIGNIIEIKDKMGRWIKIKYRDKIGYVFSGYLFNAKLIETKQNPSGTHYFNLYSLLNKESEEESDCLNNYMYYGCLLVIYKTEDDQLVNAFDGKVTEQWLDEDHIAEYWSIGDAGYGGAGIRSVNIFTKAESDIWKIETQMPINPESSEQGKETFCLKNFCFDLIKNPDIIQQIKKTHGLKYYAAGEYRGTLESYSAEIEIAEKHSILFYPDKNLIIDK